jgi:hypothetical protein
VLKSTKKELIKALVNKHTTTSNLNNVIKGKGNTIILLLYGGRVCTIKLTNMQQGQISSNSRFVFKVLYGVSGEVGSMAGTSRSSLAARSQQATRCQATKDV